MANVIGELVYKITGDATQLTSSLKNTSKYTGSLQEQFAKIDKSASVFGDTSGALAAKQALLKSKMEELINKGVNPSNKGFQNLKNQFDANTIALKGTQKGFASLSTAMKATIIGAAIAAIIKLKQFGEKLINVGSDAEEVANKFNAVFSSIRGDATEAVNELAKAYNLSNTEAQKLVGNTADILTGLGLEQKAALDLSLSVNSLSADLASFNNIPVEQASNAITKALLGEREAIKTLGIAIGEEDVKQRLLAEGKENLTGLSLRQAKAEITLKLALEQSKNALGDVARSSESLANKRKELTAVEDDYYSLIGGFLQGPAKQMTQWQIDITRNNIAMVTAFAEWVDQLKQSEGAQYTFAAISLAIKTIKDAAEKSKQAFSDFITSLKDKAIETAKDKLKLLTDKFSDLGFSISDSLTPLTVYTLAASGLGNVMKLLGQILGGVLNVFIDLATSIKTGGSAVLTFYRALSGKATFQEFKDSVKDIGTSFVNLKDNAVDNLNKIGTGFSTFTDRTKTDAKAYADSLNKIVDSNKKVNATPIDKKPITEAAEEVEKLGNSTDKTGNKILTLKDKFAILAQTIDMSLSGLSGLISSIGALQQAQFDAQAARLDEQLQKELENAGLAEESTIEKYQRELEEAQATGDKIAIEEAEKNLERAKIEEEYRKKKTKLEYEGALANWEIQKSLAKIQLFQAPLNAFNSALAIPLIGNFIAPALAALAFSTATKNYKAVETAKPQPPKFENGGIIPGSSFSGDNVGVLANSGEVILNKDQQGQLLNLANGNSNGNNLRPVYITDSGMFDILFTASKNGQLLIDERALTN